MSFPYFKGDIQKVFLRDFGVDAEVTKGDGTTLEVRGIFNSTYKGASVGDYVVDTQNPSFMVEDTDETREITKNDSIVIDSISYKITSTPQRDGIGMAKIYIIASDTIDTTGEDYTSL